MVKKAANLLGGRMGSVCQEWLTVRGGRGTLATSDMKCRQLIYDLLCKAAAARAGGHSRAWEYLQPCQNTHCHFVTSAGPRYTCSYPSTAWECSPTSLADLRRHSEDLSALASTHVPVAVKLPVRPQTLNPLPLFLHSPGDGRLTQASPVLRPGSVGS